MQWRRRTRVVLVGAGATALLLAIVVLRDDGTERLTTGDGAGETTTTTSVADIGVEASVVPVTAGASTAPTRTTTTTKVVAPVTTRPTVATTTVAPPSADTVVVTQNDGGKTITLPRGQRLTVTLQAESGWHWSSGPESDNEAVVKRESVSANPSSDRVSAGFVGQQVGTAHVGAAKDANCRSSTPPCMVPSQLWQITVNVVP